MKDLPWGEAIILPCSDLQLGSKGADVDRFKRHLEWGMKHDAYFLGLGDFMDVASPTGRQKIQSAGFYDSVHQALEDNAHQRIDEFMEIAKGTEGHWLGLLEGHHFYDFGGGVTSDTILAERLGTEFLRKCAVITLKFKPFNGSHHTASTTIWAHHGVGSGSSLAYPVNRLLRDVVPYNPGVQVFLMAHCNKLIPAKIPGFHYTKSKIVDIPRLLAGVGAFSKAYMEGTTDYVEAAMLAPVSLGGLAIKLRPTTKHGLDFVVPDYESI